MKYDPKRVVAVEPAKIVDNLDSIQASRTRPVAPKISHTRRRLFFPFHNHRGACAVKLEAIRGGGE